jgi:sugar-specific transcriptional regulator TrmB
MKLTTFFVVTGFMTKRDNIKKDLARLGLTTSQIDVYVLLLERGNQRISEIVKLLNLPRSSVYESIKTLFDIGLVEEIVENSFKLIKPYPISVFQHKIDEKLTGLQKQSLIVKNLTRSLAKLPGNVSVHATGVRYYKGRAGARQLFWNTLKAKNVIYVYSEWGRGRYVGIKFYQNFVTESYARNFQEHVLTNSSDRVLSSIRQHSNTPISRTKAENIKMVNESEIPFKGETFIYDNIYAQIFLKGEEINGFEIESQQFVDTQRSIFEKLWKTAQPLSELL